MYLVCLFYLKSIPTKSVRCDTERKKIENTFWIDSLRLTFKRRPTFVQAISGVHQTLLEMQTLTTNALRIYHVLRTNVEREKMWLKKENKNENQKKGKKKSRNQARRKMEWKNKLPTSKKQKKKLWCRFIEITLIWFFFN